MSFATDKDIEINKSLSDSNLVPIPLYYLSIAYNGETWYEKHFTAVQQNTQQHAAYKERVFKLLNDPSEKPSNYLRFFEITSIPPNINNEIKNYYDATNTYSEFFHAIPKNERCRLLRPWIKEFMDYYLRQVFSNFDWTIHLSNITNNAIGGCKTRKHNKTYYCPNNITLHGETLHYNSGLTIDDI